MAHEGDLLGKHFTKIQDLYLEFQKSIESGAPTEEIKELSEQFRKAAEEANKLVNVVQTGGILDSDKGRQLVERKEGKEAEANYQEDKGAEFNVSGNTQKVVNDAINAAGAIGQLGFAIESFHSLGSIWSDEDLTDGEKFQQTLLNLTMTLPMVLSGLSELSGRFEKSKIAQNLASIASEKNELAQKKSAKAAKALSIAEAKREAATRKAAAGDTQGAAKSLETAVALEKKAAAATKASAALNLASKATSALSKSMAALGGPLGIAMIAFSAISTLLGNYQQQMEDARAKEAETAQEATNTAKTTIDTVSQWEEYNKSFKATGKASEEFKQKSIEVAEQLGIEGAAAMAAAEN